MNHERERAWEDATGRSTPGDARRMIDALTAELDEAKRIRATNVEAGIELAKEFNRAGGIGYEADGVFRRARALLAEAMSLREQVRAHAEFLSRLHEALGTNDGAHGADILKAADELRRRADEAERLRERVMALEAEAEAARATFEDEQAAHAETLGRMLSAESRLAAIRQRAGDEDTIVQVMHKEAAAAHEAMRGKPADARTAAVLAAVGLGAVRHVMGEDEQPPQTDDLDAVEQWRENQDAKVRGSLLDTEGCGHCPGCTDENWADADLCDAQRMATKTAGQTTVEALAAVRGACEKWVPESRPERGAALASIAFLERSMGEMARAALGVLEFFPTTTEGPRRHSAEAQALSRLRAAITYALPADKQTQTHQ